MLPEYHAIVSATSAPRDHSHIRADRSLAKVVALQPLAAMPPVELSEARRDKHIRRSWSEAESDFLRAHWREMTDTEIGRRLGRTEASVRNERHKTGLINTSRICRKSGAVIDGPVRRDPLALSPREARVVAKAVAERGAEAVMYGLMRMRGLTS